MKKEEIKPEASDPVKDQEAPAKGEQAPAKDNAFDQLLRLRADFENTKKRLERDKLDAIKFANERLLSEILPVVDTIERAMKSLTEGHDPEKVKKGLELANDELHQMLETHGVKVVKTQGTHFDPNVHEAVAVVESPGQEDGQIVDEVQKGYLLNGRLIRPSRVRIVQNKKD